MLGAWVYYGTAGNFWKALNLAKQLSLFGVGEICISESGYACLSESGYDLRECS